MKPPRNLWQDPDRRRALMLTVLLHLVALFLIGALVFQPQLPQRQNYIVLDVGAPEKAPQTNEAPAAREPAPQAPTPQVAAQQAGTPQKAEIKAPQPRPAQTAGTAPVKPQPQATEPPKPSQKATAAAAKASPPKVASAKPAAPSAAEPQTAAKPPVKAEAAATPPPVTAPVPAAHVPQTTSLPALPSPVTATPEVASTALPQIHEVELKPKDLASPLQIPEPKVATQVPQARTITATPDVRVAAAKAVPQPDVQTSLAAGESAPQPQVETAAEQAVPRPQVQASVATEESLQPDARASVAATQNVPQPQVQASVAAEKVSRPSVQASVVAAKAVPRPQVQTSVAADESASQPQAEASVAAAEAVPQPQIQTSATTETVAQPTVQASVVAGQRVPQPQVQASVGSAPSASQPASQVSVAPGRSIATTPQVAVSATEAVSSPDVSVSVAQPAPRAAAAGTPGEAAGTSAGGKQEAAGLPASRAEGDRVAGGNASQAGQTDVQAAAQTGALGAATSPEGVANPSGAPAPKAIPYSETRERPLAVLLDNVKGYPQAGLRTASAIYEMPVEGGLTRLMSVYDRTDPGQVGPIRSARPYFVDLVESMKGILVHDGGSPAAMAQIKRSKLPNFDALDNGQLFARSGPRSAPYNLYASGTALREAVNRLHLERSIPVSGDIFQPSATAEAASSILINYSATYKSGFKYLPNQNQYHWQRDGASAVDAGGEAVLVDAVVVAHITAQPLPNDPEGRLYIPMRGGEATLYIHGKQVAGRWSDQGGFSFSSSGKAIDLTPFKFWVLFVPQWAEVSAH